MESSEIKKTTQLSSKERKTGKWHACDVDDCIYGTNKKSNLSRHVSEVHKGEKKTCDCGKRYTASSLSRHKHECTAALNHRSEEVKNKPVGNGRIVSTNFNINGIDVNEIADVQEHNMVIKVVTMKDGSFVLAHEIIKFGDTDYTLVPVQNVADTQLDESQLASPEYDEFIEYDPMY